MLPAPLFRFPPRCRENPEPGSELSGARCVLEVTDELLKSAFSQFGPVIAAHVMLDDLSPAGSATGPQPHSSGDHCLRLPGWPVSGVWAMVSKSIDFRVPIKWIRREKDLSGHVKLIRCGTPHGQLRPASSPAHGNLVKPVPPATARKHT